MVISLNLFHPVSFKLFSLRILFQVISPRYYPMSQPQNAGVTAKMTRPLQTRPNPWTTHLPVLRSRLLP